MDRSNTSRAQLNQERERYRQEISVALDEDDPLSVYDRFVKWTVEKFPPGKTVDSGLVELLEEAIRTFRDDPVSKVDPRYLNFWLLYADLVEKSDTVYAFMVENGIGVIYSQLYEQYALVLEKDGRIKEADDVYRRGIAHPCRGLAKFKNRYREFQDRVTSKMTLKQSSTGTHSKVVSYENENVLKAEALRRDPLMNFYTTKIPTSVQPHPSDLSKASSTSSTSRSDPYAYMTTQQPASKRPEKLRFDLSLLFRDGKEYCIQEARASSLGLLGKSWGPPPPSEFGPQQKNQHQIKVDFNDESRKDSTKNFTTGLVPNMNMTIALSGEPTVTINTKEALKEVFGMYNSPDKTMGFAPGSKHAPVKKVEPVVATLVRPTPIRNRKEDLMNENEQISTKTPAFRPFVDDLDRKENVTPAPPKFNVFLDENNRNTPAPPKFRPFVDENANSVTPAPSQLRPFVDENLGKTPSITPGGRRALAIKDTATPSAQTQRPKENGNREVTKPSTAQKSSPEDGQIGTVFARVFTPAGHIEKPLAVVEETEDDKDAGDVFHESVRYVSPPLKETKITPLVDVPAERVFSRPPEEAKRLPFRPHANSFRPTSHLPEPSASSIQPDINSDHPSQTTHELTEEDLEDPENDDPYVVEEEYDGGYEDDEEVHQAPLGGRFGQFNVMTPITERTFEFTTSTRAFGTPSGSSSLPDKGFLKQDAVEAAERLAAELREEEEQEQEQDSPLESHITADDEAPLVSFDRPRSPPFRVSEGFTIPLDPFRRASPLNGDVAAQNDTLSLADAIAVASAFKPANPCNPSDPQIISTLLSLVPLDSEYHDLRNEKAQQLDGLQKFAAKQVRRTSGNTTSNKSVDGTDIYRLQLGGKYFEVSDKLGEGGFGAVFTAKDMSLSRRPAGDDDDEDDEDCDEDEDEDVCMVALKVVKPRNIWEYHILRRIHNTLPAQCRPSIVAPHALYAFHDESFLVLDLCRQGTLLNLVNKAVPAGVSQQGGCLDELLVMFFAIELLRFVEEMHKAGFIHGDLKIDNCLLRLEDGPGGSSTWSGIYHASGEGGWKYKGIKMIDFGRTIDTRMFPADQQFIADWPTDARDCPEMRQEKPWTYQTDYFGLAGIIYCMFFGKYFDHTTVVPVSPSQETQTRYKISTPLKRYWQTDLWTRLFDALLNPCLVRPNGTLPICAELATLRINMETWLQSNCNRSTNSLKGLLKKVELCMLS